MTLKGNPERPFWLLAIGVFALLSLGIYFPVFTGKVPFPVDKVMQFPPWADFPKSENWAITADIGDLVTSFFPFRAFASEAIRQRTLPLWNPYLLGGTPFLANAQSALFYPLNAFFYVMPLLAAWTLSFILRTFLAGIFMTLFVRSIGGSKTGSILSGILFAACGFMSAWQGQAIADAAIWLPLTLYAVHWLHRDFSYRAIALTGFSFAMPVLAGHPETAGHLTLAGSFYALALWIWPAAPEARAFNLRFPVSFAAAGLLAMGLASVQMIPVLEWIGKTTRSTAERWPTLPTRDALAFVSRDILRSPNSAGIPIPEGAAYAGMMSLLAASLAPFHKEKRQVVFLTVLTFLAAAIAYSIEPVRWLSTQMPLLQSLKNGRLILVASFGICALAGLGVSTLEQQDTALSRKRSLWLLLTAAFLFSFFLYYALQQRTEMRVEFFRRPSFSRALLLLSVIPLAWRLSGGLRGRMFPIVVCGIAGFDLATFSYGSTGFAAPGEIFPPAPVFDFLAKNTAPDRFRVMRMSDTLPKNANMVYDIPSADGYEIILQVPKFFWSELSENNQDSINLTQEGVLALKDRRLDMMNVKYLVHNPSYPGYSRFEADERFSVVFKTPGIAVLENKSVLPRAMAVPATGVEVVPDVNQQLARLRNPSFDPERSVILSGLPRQGVNRGESTGLPVDTEVRITESGINHLVLKTATPQPAILVLSQTYYPGWKATIDGNDVDVFPANIALTGVALPAGSHEVRFVFQPMSFRIGALLTLMSTMILGGLLVAGLGTRRKRTG